MTLSERSVTADAFTSGYETCARKYLHRFRLLTCAFATLTVGYAIDTLHWIGAL